MAVKEAEDDENMEEEDLLPPLKATAKMSQYKKKKQSQSKLSWVDEPIWVNVLEQSAPSTDRPLRAACQLFFL